MSDPLEIEFPPDPQYTRKLRADLRAKLEHMGVSLERLDFVLLVVDEIVNNAIEHSESYRNAQGRLTIRVEVRGQDIMLDFEDPDVPEDVVNELAAVLKGPSDGTPPIDSERGRGLFLIAFNVEELEVAHRPSGGLRIRGRFPDAMA